jgi:magnesium-transporting ATPase (P-type)
VLGTIATAVDYLLSLTVVAGIVPTSKQDVGHEALAVTAHADATGVQVAPSAGWYTRSPEAVAQTFGVDPAVGLGAARAAGLLSANGPNALPEEKPRPGWRRFIGQYRSYMQIILVVAAVVSLAIKQWTTAVLLLALTVLNAVVGMRQEGKAESAMNALKSMMKATARVRRDGAEAIIPAEELVAGDVVLLSAGDQVPADGRIIVASALQIDESALTGESVPVAKDAMTLGAGELSPGEQTNMAFMNTPVTHGSGTMVVTATGAGTELGRISGMLSATEREESPLTRELDRLTLWIAGAAGLTMIVMFALGRARGQAWDALFISAVSLAIAAIPEALPTVTQTILSLGGVDLAKRNAIVKDLPSVETLGFTSAINSDKTGTLTMNQMTVVEVVDPTDRYTISGTGYGLDGMVHHAAGSTDTLEDAILPYLIASDAKLVDGTVVGDPTEGALLVLGYDNLTKYIRFVLVLLVVFVLTFLGAVVFNIAAGEPFTPAQVLWVHFIVNAPFGFALGFDRESPGLMERRPRPRGESVLTKGVVITVGLAGLAITIGLLLMIKLGQSHFGSLAVGNSIAFTAFALCLIVAAAECRSEKDTVLTTATFDSKQMNWAMFGEFVLAVLVTQMDALRRVLGTTQLNLREFAWALVPAFALLALWEAGKLIARRQRASSDLTQTDHSRINQ